MMTRRLLAYRHAAYDTPWWAFPSSRHGRFHRATAETVQYWSLHPLGPAAEMLRHNVGPFGDPDDVLLNLWAARLEVDDVVEITFDDCATHAISPDELVGDDYTPTQILADNVRRRGGGASSPRRRCLVPAASPSSAPGHPPVPGHPAEPGRVSNWSPDRRRETTGGGRPAGALVRHPHHALEQWKTTGSYMALQDPLASRW